MRPAVRSEATAAIAQRLRAVVSRRVGVAVGVWGEPGIGKTHAAKEALGELACLSLSLHATTPGPALASALPRPRRLPAWAEAGLARLSRGEFVEPGGLVDAVAATLAGLAPFVLHLEDAHEADAERLAAIRGLAGAVTRTRGAGLLVTSRAELPEPFLNHRLGPLTEAEARALLEREVGANLPREGLEWLLARARGNPLFALEFARYLRRQGFLWSDGERWRWRAPPEGYVPATVEAVVSRFVGEAVTSPRVRAALEARAVLPAVLEPLGPVWAAVAGLDPGALEASRGELERAGVLRGGAFAHPLVGEVVARELPAARRVELSRRAFEALEPHALEVALGYLALDAAGPGALDVLERVLDRARALGNPALLGSLLARLSELTEGEASARHALEAARVLKYVDANRATRLAEVAARSEAILMDATVLRAQLLAGQDRLAQALRELGDLPEHLREDRRLWEARIMTHHAARGARDVVRVWAERPELQPLAQPHVAITAASWLAFLGRHEEALELAEACSAREDLDLAARCRLMQTRLIVHSQRGEHDDCARIAAKAISLLGSEPPNPMTASFHRSLAQAHVNRGRLPEAVEAYRASLLLYVELGEAALCARIQGTLAEVLIYQAEFEQAEVALLEAHAVLARHEHALLYLTTNHFHLARLYSEWRPPHGPTLALKHAREALGQARSLEVAVTLRTALAYSACLEAEHGSVARALEHALELTELARNAPSDRDRAGAAFALGAALEANGRRAEARAAFANAAEGYERSGAPEDAQRAGLELDRLAGNPTAARERQVWFTERGWLAHARTAQRYFPDAPLAPAALEGEPPTVRLHVLGPVRLERAGQPVTGRARKRLELLAYLLEVRLAGRSEASALELVDALYPSTPEPEARATLKQQVYLIRSGLGHDSVASTPAGYALGNVSSDAEDFLATGEPTLWRGVYLGGLGEGWHAGVRDALTLALRSRVEALLITTPLEAGRLGRVLCEMEPYDPDALRLAVGALEAAGEEREARRLYASGCERLREVGEALPGSLAGFLAAQPA